jgi:hypothetical protein
MWAGVFYGQPVGRDFIIEALPRVQGLFRERLLAIASLSQRISAVRYSLPSRADIGVCESTAIAGEESDLRWNPLPPGYVPDPNLRSGAEAWAVCCGITNCRVKAIQHEVAESLHQIGLQCTLQYVCQTSRMRIDIALPELGVAMLLLSRMSFLDQAQYRINGSVALEQRLLQVGSFISPLNCCADVQVCVLSNPAGRL